jgi:hypothetical protein
MNGLLRDLRSGLRTMLSNNPDLAAAVALAVAGSEPEHRDRAPLGSE